MLLRTGNQAAFDREPRTSPLCRVSGVPVVVGRRGRGKFRDTRGETTHALSQSGPSAARRIGEAIVSGLAVTAATWVAGATLPPVQTGFWRLLKGDPSPLVRGVFVAIIVSWFVVQVVIEQHRKRAWETRNPGADCPRAVLEAHETAAISWASVVVAASLVCTLAVLGLLPADVATQVLPPR